MRASGFLAALSLIAISFAQGPPEGVAPSEPSPEGCEDTVSGNFTLGIKIISSKHRRLSSTTGEVVATSNGALVCTLNDGILRDSLARTGSIVANYQFQFDGPPQAGAIYTGGWSVCKNNSLAIGPNTTFYHCMSGDFANLYTVNIGAQCQPADIIVSRLNQPSSSSNVASTVTSGVVESATSSASAATSTINSNSGTLSTGMASSTTSAPNSATSSVSPPDAPPVGGVVTGSTGGALPTRVPRKETFGAVIGVLGAALIL